jgi:hypothetical protein
LQAISGQQIGLFDEVEHRVFSPLRILEALVAGGRFNDRLSFMPCQALGGGLPQVKGAFPELDLSLDQFVGVFQQPLKQFLERFADDGGIKDRNLIVTILALEIFLQHALTLLDDLGEVLGQLVEISGFEIGSGRRGRLSHNDTSLKTGITL